MSATITIIGRLGADPVFTFSPNGISIAKMRVVTSGRKREEDGSWVDIDTTWWSVTAFKTTADNVAETLAKGTPIIVVGTIKGREWEDIKTGEKRRDVEIIANSIGIDLSRVKGQAARPAQQTAGSQDNGWGSEPDPWNTPSPPIPF
jgi:single-strand DNA-binding protein